MAYSAFEEGGGFKNVPTRFSLPCPSPVILPFFFFPFSLPLCLFPPRPSLSFLLSDQNLAGSPGERCELFQRDRTKIGRQMMSAAFQPLKWFLSAWPSGLGHVALASCVTNQRARVRFPVQVQLTQPSMLPVIGKLMTVTKQ